MCQKIWFRLVSCIKSGGTVIRFLSRVFWAINSCVVISRYRKIFFYLIDLVSCADRCGRVSKTHMTFACWNIVVACSIPAQPMGMYGQCFSLSRWNKWHAFVNMVMNTRVPYNVANLLTWWEYIILSKMTASSRFASRHFRWVDPPPTKCHSKNIASQFFLNSNKVKGFTHESWGRRLYRSNMIWQHVERLYLSFDILCAFFSTYFRLFSSVRAACPPYPCFCKYPYNNNNNVC